MLFIDDDPSIVDAVGMLLKAVVSDYRLPGYNGVEVVRRVRQVTAEGLPAVIMTGDTPSQEIEAANLRHCTVLHKPVDTDRLISMIESISV